MKYIFGPVNSRRLGISLGIDLVPFKVCTLNCVYCECGATTDLLSDQDIFAPIDEVIRELDSFLAGRPKLDVLTFSGSGEPTLHRQIGTVIKYIKDTYPEYAVAVLTNGTLLWSEDVREALYPADIVIPSLDAVSEDVFKSIGRPAPGITAEKTVQGLVEFSRKYQGTLILEVFIVPGINDSQDELEKIKQVCIDIHPAKVQLNSIDRPGTEDWVSGVEEEDRLRIVDVFNPVSVEWISKPAVARTNISTQDTSAQIIEILKRRPSTMEDLESVLDIKRTELRSLVNKMLKDGIITTREMGRGVFYRVVDTDE